MNNVLTQRVQTQTCWIFLVIICWGNKPRPARSYEQGGAYLIFTQI